MADPAQARHKFERWVQESALFQEKQRKRANEAHDFHDSNQWTREEIFEVESRHQSPSVINIILPTINSIAAIEAGRRTDYKVVPREISDDNLATVLTETSAQVLKENQFNFFLSRGFRTGLISGISWFEIFPETDFDTEEIQIRIELRKWEDFYYDPHACRPDLLDAKYISREVWMDVDEARDKYGKDIADRMNRMIDTAIGIDPFKGQEFEAQSTSGGYTFVDRKNRRVAVHSMYYRTTEGEVKYVVFTGSVFLPWFDGDGNAVQTGEEGANPSPWDYNYIPYVPYIPAFDKEGRPLALVEHLKSISRLINKAQSKQQWLLAAKRCLHETGTFTDPELAREEWAKPDAWVEFNEGAIREGKFIQDDNVQESSQTLGWIQFLVLMAQRISGVSDAVAGFGGVNARSAQQETQRIAQGAGMQTPSIEALYFTKLQVFRVVLKMIGQFYTNRRVVRIMESNGSSTFLTLNGIDENGFPLNKIDDILQYDVDVVEELPFSNVNELFVTSLSEIMKSNPALTPALITPIIESMPHIKGKEQIIAGVQQLFQQDQQAQQDERAGNIVGKSLVFGT